MGEFLIRGESPSKAPEYQVWSAMLNRCYRPATNSYRTHGARGIKVCARWLPAKLGGSGSRMDAFSRFFSDMGDRPDSMTIERVGNNGHYTPSNCAWASPKRQANNRRNTLLVKIGRKKRLISEWATESGICGSLLRHRLMSGWPAEHVLDPVGKSGQREMDVLQVRLWQGKRPVDEHPAVSRIDHD